MASSASGWSPCTAANLEASWPSRRAAKAASIRLSAGRSLCLLHLSEQNLTSVAAVFAEFDFLEPDRIWLAFLLQYGYVRDCKTGNEK